MQSEHVRLSNLQDQYDRVDDLLEDYLFRLDIKGKNATRFSLLVEEALRLAKSITKDESAVEIWFEGNSRVSHICLQLESDIDPNKQEQFISISSNKENSADKTFFDELRNFFIKPATATWSLSNYEAELLLKRANDKYAQESWDNLERSVLANLADDIQVGVKHNNVLMVITKDFTESLITVKNKKPIFISEQLFLAADDSSLEKAYEKVDGLIDSLKLSKKDSLHVKLLVEETIGMVKGITGKFKGLLWVEKFESQCSVKLISKTLMNADIKHDMLSMSSSGKNDLAKGTMGKIKDIIETGLLNYESVMKLQQEYNGVSIGFGGLGVYNDIGLANNPGAFSGFMWSMADYQKQLKEGKDSNEGMKAAWDELEKSIVASIAKDVVVGVKGNNVELTIVYDYKEE